MGLRAIWWGWSTASAYRRADFYIDGELVQEQADVAAAAFGVLSAEWRRHPIEWFCLAWLTLYTVMLAADTPLFHRVTIVLLGCSHLAIIGLCLYRGAQGRTTNVAAVIEALAWAEPRRPVRRVSQRPQLVQPISVGEPALRVIDLAERRAGSGDYVVRTEPAPAAAPNLHPPLIGLAHSEGKPKRKRRLRAAVRPANAATSPRRRRTRNLSEAAADPAPKKPRGAAKKKRAAKPAAPKRPRRKKTPPPADTAGTQSPPL